MRYKRFEIRNFKGIRHASVELDPFGAARVYSLVGLNESGKTTILEAIHSFSPDADTEIVVGSASTAEEQRRQRVPKDKVSDFTGDIQITATIVMDEGDVERIISYCRSENFEIDPACLKEEFLFRRIQRYKNGDFVDNFRWLSLNVSVRSGRQRQFRKPDWGAEESKVYNFFESLFPIISYFPTFIFDFPHKINLSDRYVSKVNAFYKNLFQDILDYDGRGHKIKDHIIDRIGKDEYKVEYVAFIPIFTKTNDSEKIQQVVDRAARAVTNVVFDRWNKIFGENASDKEVVIKFGIEEAPEKLVSGKKEKSTDHDLWIEFFVKDGVKRFPIKDRSLGFRWFFSFLLFTQFRAARSDQRPILFLLDEPASNLHAAAQQKLIESFPEIAKNPHTLIYSTHSHYMIEPSWLEQCYVVKNDPADSYESIVDQSSVEDDAYDVQAIPYKKFVSENPSKTSYFQPIVDRLDVVPSRFDLDKRSIIVEGKSDYYILEYFSAVHWKRELGLMPGLGSGTLESLIAIHRGWGLPVRVMLDSDEAGKKEIERYREKFALAEDEVFLIGSIVSGAKEIEGIVSDADRAAISSFYHSKKAPTKKQILTFFQAALAARKRLKLDKVTEASAKLLLDALEARVKT
jgi:AAA15 family ATPase/GTPase